MTNALWFLAGLAIGFPLAGALFDALDAAIDYLRQLRAPHSGEDA